MKSLLLRADRVIQNYTPDPFLIAIGLTFLSGFFAVTLTDTSTLETVRIWGEGFWGLLTFTLQMVMILLGGYLMATTPPITRLLKKLVSFAKNPLQGVILTTLLACLAAWINWGFGLVIGALVAIEMKKHLPQASFRVLVASAYGGFVVWHSGLSASIPLLLNTKDNFSYDQLGRLVPLNETIFSEWNLTLLVAVILTLLVCNILFQKHLPEDNSLDPSLNLKSEPEKDSGFKTWLEETPYIGTFVGLCGLSYLLIVWLQGNFSLNLNSINFLFLFGALLLHGNLHSFLKSVRKGATKVGPILIQYPFYSGIMAVLKGTGLAVLISQGFTAFASSTTFPFFSFLSAGVVNFFVPSGGGQWAIQGPIVLPAISELNADFTKSIMAVAWGDAWTNLAQPFWALPLLVIAGLSIRHILSLCLVQLIAVGSVISIFLFL